MLLVGHLDTVVAHEAHRPLAARGRPAGGLRGGGHEGRRRARARARCGHWRRAPERYAEAALLLVVDEEWRTEPFAHAARFAGWDACLCFEAGQLTAAGEEAVVVRRKAAGTLRVRAPGAPRRTPARPPTAGANALLALAEAARLRGRPPRPARARTG